MRLSVIRHAPTLGAEGRCVGRTEVAIALPHERAAELVLARLTERVDVVWSSPLDRCAGTARLVARALGAEHRVDERLLEIDHGRFEGRTWSELEQDEAEALAHWMQHWEEQGPPGGESARDVEARLRAWWDALEDDALLVAHAGAARALRVVVAGATWPAAMSTPVRHLELDAVYLADPRPRARP